MAQAPAAESESIRIAEKDAATSDTGPYNVTGGTANQTSSFYRMGSFFIRARSIGTNRYL